MAIILVLLLFAEVRHGLMKQGRPQFPRCSARMSRLIVLAGLLWGFGAIFAILLIDVGHRRAAARIPARAARLPIRGSIDRIRGVR
jgi:hypothetical protein